MSTEQTAVPPANNPLSKFFRTPAIYIGLPSGGRWWKDGALELPENGELPVYPMTNRDEIMIRTPDALINGQGVTDVIQSCMPNIKDAWKMPSVDVDTCLIAMRIASYGHKMDFTNKCPHCKAEHDYAVDLRVMLDSIKCPDYDKDLDIGVIKIKFRPQMYWETNFTNKTSFEVRKLQMALEALPGDEEDEEKTKALTDQLMRVNEINHSVMASSIEYIEIVESGERVGDQNFIKDFLNEVDRKIFDQIQNEITKLQEQGAVKPVKVNCNSCNEPLDIAILFDYSNFFVVGS
jgi:hypothetical protein